MSNEPESSETSPAKGSTEEQAVAWSNAYASQPVLKRGLRDTRQAITPFNPASAHPGTDSSPFNPSSAATEANLPSTEPPAQPPGRFSRYLPLLKGTAYVAAFGGSLMTALALGILAAQVLPGRFDAPPLPEAVLRKSSRVASRLWHFHQLWQSPTDEIRIEAIPLPESGPVLAPVELSPIERQPLIDELNAIETEIVTLDRRLQTLEKRLGTPPYQGADIDSRVNTLRAAIDPPVRPEKAAIYEPVPSDPTTALLAVTELKMTMPSDALFAPGQSDLKDTVLLHQVLDQLVNYPGATVVIRSYSDDQARAADSRKYTFAQSSTLSDHLQAALPEPYRWVIVGGGQSLPVASNEDAIGRQRNRRIEILVDSR